MKYKAKMKLRNILVMSAFGVSVVSAVLSVIVKIKYWEYSGLWILMNKTSESMISLVGAAIAIVLLIISSVIEK